MNSNFRPAARRSDFVDATSPRVPHTLFSCNARCNLKFEHRSGNCPVDTLWPRTHDIAPVMSNQLDSPSAATARAARAKLEKCVASLLSSRGLSHWKPFLAAARCLLPYELEECYPAALAPNATLAEVKEVALVIAEGDASGDEQQLPFSETAMVDEFRRNDVQGHHALLSYKPHLRGLAWQGQPA
eukprot:413227-Pleurochrysis_carterae.AAC.1